MSFWRFYLHLWKQNFFDRKITKIRKWACHRSNLNDGSLRGRLRVKAHSMTQVSMILTRSRTKVKVKFSPKWVKKLNNWPSLGCYFTHRLLRIYHHSCLWFIWALPSCGLYRSLIWPSPWGICCFRMYGVVGAQALTVHRKRRPLR